MANLIEDVFGAIAHIMEHAAEYGGDPTRIGGHGRQRRRSPVGGGVADPGSIGSCGFGKTPGVFEFKPSYLPKGKTSRAECARRCSSAIKAAAPSYGVFGRPRLNHYTDNPAADDAWKAAIAPQPHISRRSARGAAVPGPRHARTASIWTTMCKVHRSAGQSRASAWNTCRSAARDTRSSTGSRRDHQGDFYQVRRLLRGGDEGVLRVGPLLIGAFEAGLPVCPSWTSTRTRSSFKPTQSKRVWSSRGSCSKAARRASSWNIVHR